MVSFVRSCRIGAVVVVCFSLKYECAFEGVVELVTLKVVKQPPFYVKKIVDRAINSFCEVSTDSHQSQSQNTQWFAFSQILFQRSCQHGRTI